MPEKIHAVSDCSPVVTTIVERQILVIDDLGRPRLLDAGTLVVWLHGSLEDPCLLDAVPDHEIVRVPGILDYLAQVSDNGLPSMDRHADGRSR